MPSLAKNYDKISGVYRDVAKNIYDPTLNMSLTQIQKWIDPSSAIKEMLDLGCGSGETLRRVQQHFPEAQYTGVDISENMLKEAATKLNLKTVQSDIAHIGDKLPSQHFDLSFAHFVLGYVELPVLLNKAKQLLKNQGYLSIATNGEDSFHAVKNIVRDSCSRIRPLKKIIDYKIAQGMKKTKNQIDWNNIQKTVQLLGFELLSFETLKVECFFSSSKELFDYIFYGSWGIGELKPYIPIAVYRFFYTLFLNRLMSFPFKDSVHVQVLLLKRFTP